MYERDRKEGERERACESGRSSVVVHDGVDGALGLLPHGEVLRACTQRQHRLVEEERQERGTHLRRPLAVEARKVEAHLAQVAHLLALKAVEVALDRRRGEAQVVRERLDGVVELRAGKSESVSKGSMGTRARARRGGPSAPG